MVTISRQKMNGLNLFCILVLTSFFTLYLYGPDLARAQEVEYPSKTINIIIPFAPGGLVDVTFRLMEEYLSEELQVPLVIENHPGAAGFLGAAKVLKAKPDGYTIFVASDSLIVTAPQTSANPPYDPFRDFLHICTYGVSPLTLCVPKSSPFKDISELVEYAKREPGKLTGGITQHGGANHLAYELFKKSAGVNITTVPYKGTGAIVAALLGKHIDMLSLSYIGMYPYITSGEARALAASGPVPDPSIPTFIEKGWASIDMGPANTVFVSAGTPKPVHEKLVLVFGKVARNPDLIKKWEKIGLRPNYMNPKEFWEFAKQKSQIHSDLLDELGLKGQRK